jgi:hypothetical protein
LRRARWFICENSTAAVVTDRESNIMHLLHLLLFIILLYRDCIIQDNVAKGEAVGKRRGWEFVITDSNDAGNDGNNLSEVFVERWRCWGVQMSDKMLWIA